MNKYFLVALLFLLCFPYSSEAYWPLTVGENLAVSAIPDTYETYCSSIPFSDGSTLVVFWKSPIGIFYQIIDKYGELKFTESQMLVPNPIQTNHYEYVPIVIEDSEGGAIVVCSTHDSPFAAIYGQRLDSLGNRLWGDNGKVFFTVDEFDYDACPDGEGGFYLAVAIAEPLDWDDLYLQHIDSDGNLYWGGYGISVGNLTGYTSRYPKVITDGNGGCYVLFEDNRPPYTADGAQYLQRFDASGNRLWAFDLLVDDEPGFNNGIISDNMGGCIAQGGFEPNTHCRVDSTGQILWRRRALSYGEGAEMMLGEPGILYLIFTRTFNDTGIVFLQRVDIETGDNFFPTYPINGRYGAPLCRPYYNMTSNISSFYRYPYLYTVYFIQTEFTYNHYFYALKSDSLANWLWGERGIFMSEIGTHSIPYRRSVSDGFGGLTYVFTHEANPVYDIYAKHVNANGTVGGPLPQAQNLIITLSDNDVVLTWNAMGDSVLYRIYKSVQPYSFPVEPDTVIADTTYIDINAINEGVLFYNVRWEP